MTPFFVARTLLVSILLAALWLCMGCATDPASRPPTDSLTKARTDNGQAMELIGRGKYVDAEPLLRSAIEADPTYGQARNNLGLVYYHTGRSLDEAARQFDEATRLMPGRPEPLNNLGLVWERARDFDKAIDAYAKAYRLEPADAEYLANLARAHVRRGDNDPETRRLLEELILKDSRPQWNEWARTTLLRLKSVPTEPATRGA